MGEADLSSLSLALLGLIDQKPRSGYDLRKIFAFSPMAHFSNSTGAVYPALRRLKREGLIEGKAGEGKTLRPKEVFRLTASGKRRMRSELAMPVEREDVIRNLDRLMLRLAFMDQFLKTREILKFVRNFLSEVEKYRRSLEDYYQAHRTSLHRTGRYVFEAGIEGYRSRESLALRVIRDLERVPGRKSKRRKEDA